nr:hypothetical protein [uncultured Carboxylicivirga sp.]
MNKLIGFLVVIIAVLGSLPLQAQIYKKELIYEFDYCIEKEGSTINGKLYLGCLGKEFQTPSEWQYAVMWTKDKNELNPQIKNTGIIENKNRVWLHPPRMKEFSVLEYSPFPQIKYPFKVGTKWNWSLTPGSNWISKELGVGEDDVLEYQFQITNNVKEFTFLPYGNQMCFLVKAESTNGKTQSAFTGYFNEKLGFIKMIYNNRDGSIITFKLADVIEWTELVVYDPAFKAIH